MRSSLVVANAVYWNSTFAGGIYNSGNAVLIDSTVQGNVAAQGGGIQNAAGASLQFTSSSLRSNHSRFFGGAVYSEGVMHLSNSTVSSNNDSVHNLGVLSVENSTVTNGVNWRVTGGIYNHSGVVTLRNSIVAGNIVDCGGAITSLGHNLDGDGTCGLSAEGDQPSANPQLGPYQDNGGPTRTHALLAGSPAIDAGDPAACPAADQRGILRPVDGDMDGSARCDIGAYEYEPPRLYLPLVQR